MKGLARMILVAMVAGSMVVGSSAFAFQRPDVARSSPSGAGGSLPRPPRQDEPWTPPKSALPVSLVEASRALFEQGLADPRGCAYREVELAGEAEAYRDFHKRPPATHAWVIPFEGTGGPRYAVAWNGLVYPVTRLGPAADLEADIRVLAKTFEGSGGLTMAPAMSHGLYPDPMRQGRASGDLQSAKHHDLAPTKAVLLLRLGRADLAELIWKAGPGWQAAVAPGGPIQAIGLYANLAADWVWALLDRAASAHSRADDPLALASLRELARIRPLIEARAPIMRLGGAGPRNGPGFEAPDFLVELPRFLTDQERRAREPKRTPALTSTFPDRETRIAAMIRDFDQISQQAAFMPGRANPAGDRAVQAIIKEGDAAVGPLLDSLERDDRLTRTVDRDYRHNSRYLHIQGVDEAAYAALCAILGTRELGPEPRFYGGRADRAKRRAAAAEIREYWEKNRGLGTVERLFRTLADAGATREQWLDAAEALAQPNDVRGRGFVHVTPFRFGGKVPPPRGEPLRGRVNPSITELMARRARELDLPEAGLGSGFEVQKANRMAEFLAEWDLKGALPTLKVRAVRCAAMLRMKGPSSSPTDGFDVAFARFTLLRVKGGDVAALKDYAIWIREIQPPSYGSYAPGLFEPLWRYPVDPAIAAAAVALFDDPGSPWVVFFRPRGPGRGEGFRSGAIASPLIGVAPFRKLVLAGLADETPSGSVVCDAAGKAAVSPDQSGTMFYEFHLHDPHRPRPNTSMTIRMRDYFASQLSGIGGFPRFEFYWPQELRDRTIGEVVALLSRYGERLRTTEVSQMLYEQASFYPKSFPAVLVFAPLDRPATAADVAAGRAIFAAGPGAEVRRWPMPAVPMEGRWMELEIPPDDPYLRQYDRMPAKHSPQLDYPQRGLVWQAEEVREGDRWRRYYGFIGRHEIARVPAEEMDFPSPWNTGWSDLSRDLEARLVPPGGRDDGRLILRDPVPIGGPLPIAMTLRNRRGIAVTIPTDLARAGGRPALSEGVSVRVFREPAPARPDPVAGLSRGVPEPAPWTEVEPRREPDRCRPSASRVLDPTGTAEVLRLDLRELFALDRPGRYRIEIALVGIRTEEERPAQVSADFTLKAAEDAIAP